MEDNIFKMRQLLNELEHELKQDYPFTESLVDDIKALAKKF